MLEKKIFRQNRTDQEIKDLQGDANPLNKNVVIAAPDWVEEGLKILSEKLKDATFIEQGIEYELRPL